MILRDGKFLEAVFDGNFKLIRAVWLNHSTNIASEVIAQIDENDRLYAQILKEFSLDQIQEMTDKKNKVE
jgi:hypothetical protein